MSRLLFLYAMIFLCVTEGAAQREEAVLMTVAGEPVMLSEYLYAYDKNRKLSGGASADPSVYLNDYITFRLNVAMAGEMGLDTLPDVREHLQSLSFSSNQNKEYTPSAQAIRVGHLFFPLPQRAGLMEESRVKAKADSVYQQLLQGQDFLEVADRLSSRERSLVWLERCQWLPELEDAAYALAPGEMSRPLLATDGFHILKRYPVEGGNGTELSGQPGNNPAHYLQMEYRNGILCQALYDKILLGRAERDTVGLARYFADHRKAYEWTIPHYKGLLYHCKDKKTLKRMRKLLKKSTGENWKALLSQPQYADLLQNVKLGAYRLYRLSEDPYVDQLVFGGPDVPPLPDYPYAGVSGKELKKHPDDYRDVKEAVIADYQAHLEQKWNESLRKRFSVSVDEKVLKKVNIK